MSTVDEAAAERSIVVAPTVIVTVPGSGPARKTTAGAP